jgi:hypothetical protein
MNNILKAVIGVLGVSGLLAMATTMLNAPASEPTATSTNAPSAVQVAGAPQASQAPEPTQAAQSTFVTNPSEQSYAKFGEPMMNPAPVGEFAFQQENNHSETGTPQPGPENGQGSPPEGAEK